MFPMVKLLTSDASCSSPANVQVFNVLQPTCSITIISLLPASFFFHFPLKSRHLLGAFGVEAWALSAGRTLIGDRIDPAKIFPDSATNTPHATNSFTILIKILLLFIFEP